MSRVVFDIETLGFPIESFDDTQREYLLKFAENEEQREETIQKLALYPTTAQIIAIGMLNPDTSRGKVLYQADRHDESANEDGSVRFIACDERQILETFWTDIAQFQQFITFNGRSFDCPFIMMRSAILGIKPTKNLMPYRYDPSLHCDLLEQFTFYGATRKFNLDFYCKAFSVESPKSHGITGLDLQGHYEKKHFKTIAEYNMWDLQATAELFRRWEGFLKV